MGEWEKRSLATAAIATVGLFALAILGFQGILEETSWLIACGVLLAATIWLCAISARKSPPPYLGAGNSKRLPYLVAAFVLAAGGSGFALEWRISQHDRFIPPHPLELQGEWQADTANANPQKWDVRFRADGTAWIMETDRNGVTMDQPGEWQVRGRTLFYEFAGRHESSRYTLVSDMLKLTIGDTSVKLRRKSTQPPCTRPPCQDTQ